MRAFAKTATAGTNEANGKRRAIFSRALRASRGPLDGARGSGAPSGRRTRFVLGVAAVFALVLVLGVTLASAVVPTVLIDNASSVSYTSAHASGEVDPQAQPSTYRFQYLSDTQLQENLVNGFPEWEFANTAKEEAIEGASQPVEAELTGLAPGTTYHLRLVAENADGQSEAVAGSTFTTDAVAVPDVTIAAPDGVTGTAAHFTGTVDTESPSGNPAAFDVTWQFELSADAGASWSPVGGGTIPADNPSPAHPVEADATGLNPGKSYEVRLSGTNAGGTAIAGPEGFTEPTIAPVLSAISANPSSHEATLRGTIDPGGAETTYHFEYGPTSSYGQSTPSQTLPSGNDPVKVSAVVQGLTPATGYHYKLVTTNSVGSTETVDFTFTTASGVPAAESCPNAEIRIQQGSTWLPECRAFELVNLSGLDLGDVTRSPATSDDGSHVAWESPVLPDAAIGGQSNYVGVANRGPSGWTNVDANAVYPTGVKGTAVWGIAGFSHDFTRELRQTPVPFDPSDQDGSLDFYRTNVDASLGTKWVTREPPASFKTLIGVNTDMSRVIYETQRIFDQRFNLYAWDEAEGIEMVSILPNGDEVAARAAAYAYQQTVGEFSAYTTIAPHGGLNPTSVDGTRIFFVSGNIFNGALYMRDTKTDTTVLVSKSQRTGEVGSPVDAIFLGASPNSDVGYFQTAQPATDDPAPDGGIYEFNLATQDLTLVAPVGSADTHFGSPPNNNGTAVPSDDASHLYFTTEEVLPQGGTSGALNAYVWGDGNLKFIAAIPGNQAAFARASRNGRYGVFVTPSEVNGSSNNGQEAIFEYDAVTEKLACISCRPDGSPSEGSASLKARPFSTLGNTTMRNISDTGQVFFTSTDRIVPQDKTNARDVYEYDAGVTTLLTEGRGDDSSYVLDNSDDGHNVFVLTRSAFLPQDQDAAELDIYDLRIGGGFPSQQGQSPVVCLGESCQGPAPPVPPWTSPGSTVTGPPNAKHKKKHHKKKQHKKKQHKKHKGSKGKHQRETNRNWRTVR